MSTSTIAAILAATLVLPVVALGNSHGHAELNHSAMPSFITKASNKEPLKYEQTTIVRGTVAAIDPVARLVMLKRQDGRTFDVQVSDGVKNFDKVGVGDVIEATYTESVVFQVVPKGETQGGAVPSVTSGAKVGQKVISSFKVASVDPITNVLSVTMPDGTPKPIHFDEKSQAPLMALMPGDVISATYTESAAIRLKKLAK